MTTKDFKTIAILVELEDGSAHQVLATKENKHLVIDMLSTMEGGLKISERIEPVTFKTAK